MVATEVEVRAMVQSDTTNSESPTTTTANVYQITSRPLIIGLTPFTDHTWPMDAADQPKFNALSEEMKRQTCRTFVFVMWKV